MAKVLILSLNYAPDLVGIAVYSTGMAEALATAGHHVTVVCAPPYYPSWKVARGYRNRLPVSTIENGVEVVRCPLYVPKRPTGARRIIHHFSFALSVTVPMLWRGMRDRPEVVICIGPSLIAAPAARLAAMLAGAKSWLHIHDFEVDVAFSTSLLQRTGPIAKLALAFERMAMGMFDVVSSISPMMCARLASKGVREDRILEFRNWADTAAVRPLTRQSAYRREWGINSRYVALYSGNVANKQGIGIVVEAARRLAHREDLTFVVCGEGPNLPSLKAQAEGLSNIQFHRLQPKDRLNELLGLASVHLLPQIPGAADLVLPSKLSNMLASGRPVVGTAAEGTGLAGELRGCGLVVEPGDAGAFSAAIEKLLDDPALCSSLGRRARLRAEQHWDSKNILGWLDTEVRRLAEDMPSQDTVVPKHLP